MADDTSPSDVSSSESVTTFLVLKGEVVRVFFFRGEVPFCSGLRGDVDRLGGGEGPETKRAFLDGLPFVTWALGLDSGSLALGVADGLVRRALLVGEEDMGIRDGFVGERRSSSSESSEADTCEDTSSFRLDLYVTADGGGGTI